MTEIPEHLRKRAEEAKAKAAAKMQHPAIVTIFEASRTVPPLAMSA